MSSPIPRWDPIDRSTGKFDAVAVFAASGSDKNINLKMIAARHRKHRPAMRIAWEEWDIPQVGEAVCCRKRDGEILGYGRVIGRRICHRTDLFQVVQFVVEFSMPTRWVEAVSGPCVESLAILDKLAYISGEAMARRLDELDEIQEQLELEDLR